MAGLYIHIPFCRKACVYCDFHFSTQLTRKAEMVDALCQEIALRKDYLGPEASIQTLYFGGGTPSLLSIEELGLVLEQIKKYFHLLPTAEITIEANPDDLQYQYLEGLQVLGVNRLSIGIQSFSDAQLQFMNRTHTANQAVKSVEAAKQLGIHNISVDLIYGLPNTDPDFFKEEIHQLLTLDVPHLSLYALTLEPKTALDHMVKKGKLSLAIDSKYRDQFLYAHERLEAAGYVHYELSNYAQAGFRSQHNSAYWKQIPYLGIGPSAHSYDGIQRCWNHAQNSKYLSKIQAGTTAIQAYEKLSKRDQYHEYIMTQLRKREGIDLQKIQRSFSINIREKYASHLERWVKHGYGILGKSSFRLSPEGWLVSDSLIEELFLPE